MGRGRARRGKPLTGPNLLRLDLEHAATIAQLRANDTIYHASDNMGLAFDAKRSEPLMIGSFGFMLVNAMAFQRSAGASTCQGF
jgi:hypothetical protein